MEDLINTIFNILAGTPVGQYLTVLVMVCYILSHLVQYLPVEWTTKIPNWVMVIINTIAAKHGAGKSAKTDIKGNPIK